MIWHRFDAMPLPFRTTCPSCETTLLFEPPPGTARLTLHCRMCNVEFVAESDKEGRFTGANRPMIQRAKCS
jgi:hypothetical protein